MINIPNHFFHFFSHDKFLNNFLNFHNFSGNILNLNYFFNLFLYFFELLYDNRDFNYSLNYFLDVIVDIDKMRNYSFHFNYLRNFYHDLSQYLGVVYLRNCVSFLYDFLYDELCSDNLLILWFDSNNFLYNCRNLFNNLLNVWHYSFYFFDFSVNHNLLHYLFYFMNNGLLFCYCYYFLYDLWYNHSSFYNIFLHNYPLYYSINRDSYLQRDY